MNGRTILLLVRFYVQDYSGDLSLVALRVICGDKRVTLRHT